jgi:hypothetical protein
MNSAAAAAAAAAVNVLFRLFIIKIYLHFSIVVCYRVGRHRRHTPLFGTTNCDAYHASYT